MKLTILLVPSRAAAVEIPRRLAAVTERAQAGLLPMKLQDLVAAIGEPALLGRGLRAWDSGHGPLLAAGLLDDAPVGLIADELPRAPLGRVLARTFAELRLAGVAPEDLAELSGRATLSDDSRRLAWIAQIYRRFHDAVAGRFADPATLLRAASEALPTCVWLRQAEVLIVDDLELAPLEESFVADLARLRPVRRLVRPTPVSLRADSFSEWAEAHGISAIEPASTVLAPLLSSSARAELRRIQCSLFDPPSGEAANGTALELVTAAGEAAEVRAIVRRILREAARGVPFEEMAVILPRPEEYARLFTDLLSRLRIPHRLHPSLPLRFGRVARSLLLLFRCRGLGRREVMELLTFAPIPFSERLGAEVIPRVAQWDLLSRQAGIVSGLDRWEAGLTAVAGEEEAFAARETDPERRERRLRRAEDGRTLLGLVRALDATLAELLATPETSWAEWSERLVRVFDDWTSAPAGDVAEHVAVRTVLLELARLGAASPRATWSDVEAVLESRFEWERLPAEPPSKGGVHVGALSALAGLPFRWVAIVGLVEGGFPGVLRPDPLLLDDERRHVAAPAAAPVHSRRQGQLSLFDEEPVLPSAVAGALWTTQDRLLEARRLFQRATAQATERLVLSYPRADPRSGRERLPSLFFIAAASARVGQPVSVPLLTTIVEEDATEDLSLEESLDASERDRVRVRLGGDEAAQAIAAGSRFFRQSHLASHARWSKAFTPYDGLVAGPPVTPEIGARLDPATSPWPVSASGLAMFAQCGFKYLLQYVLRLDPAPDPEERTRLDPLERGSLFHEVAEHFLRERRDSGQLPLRDTGAERQRLREIADERLQAFVAGAPPRFTVLWERERERFLAGLMTWLAREARHPESLPLHFEVGFGLRSRSGTSEPHLVEPLTVELGDGRAVRVSGKIDRIDRRVGAGLVVRDYKTGRPPSQPGVFRGGRQLQIPFYVLAVQAMFPGERVAEAFLDYVDEGLRIPFDPEAVIGEPFRVVLRAVVSAIAAGNFVQESSACEWCDFKRVCGPAALIERRRRYKIGDRRVQQYLRLRDLG